MRVLRDHAVRVRVIVVLGVTVIGLVCFLMGFQRLMSWHRVHSASGSHTRGDRGGASYASTGNSIRIRLTRLIPLTHRTRRAFTDTVNADDTAPAGRGLDQLRRHVRHLRGELLACLGVDALLRSVRTRYGHDGGVHVARGLFDARGGGGRVVGGGDRGDRGARLFACVVRINGVDL